VELMGARRWQHFTFFDVFRAWAAQRIDCVGRRE
jgi:hypothetical protein